MKAKYFILFIFIFLINLCTAQPLWYNNQEIGSCCIYFTASGSASNKSDAETLAISAGITEIIFTKTITVSGELETIRKYKQEGKNVTEDISEFSRKLNISGNSQISGVKKVFSEYEKNKNGYTCYILLAIPNENYESSDCKVLYKSNFHTAWRSALIPGWGQRYKFGQKKGWIYTTSYFSSIAFIGISWYANNYYYNLSLTERDPYIRAKYINNAMVWNTFKYVGLGSMIGINIFNLFHVISTKGKIEFANSNYKLYPSYCYNTFQLSFNYKF